jgi:tetratricopeptide (TPR) repeat protein
MGKIDELKKAIADQPDSAKAQLNLGTFLLLKKRNAKEAEQAIRRAIEIDPGYDKAWVNLGGLLLARWDFEGCVETNLKALECNPELVEAHYNLGLGYLYLKDAEKMVDCFRRVVELDQDHAGGHYHLAIGLLHLGQVVEAEIEGNVARGLGYRLQPDFLKELEKQVNIHNGVDDQEITDGVDAVTEIEPSSGKTKH